MATYEEFRALTTRVTELEILTRRLLKTLCQVQSIFEPLTRLDSEDAVSRPLRGSTGITKSSGLFGSAFSFGSDAKGSETTPRQDTRPVTFTTLNEQSDSFRITSDHGSTNLFGNSAFTSRLSQAGFSTSSPATTINSAAPAFPTQSDRPGTSQSYVSTGLFDSGVGAAGVSSLKRSTIPQEPRPGLIGTTNSSRVSLNTDPASSPTQDDMETKSRAYMKPYTYKKLDVAQNQIRLLAVQKSDDFNAPVTARIIIESLDVLDASRLANRPRGGIFGGSQRGFLFGRPLTEEPLHHRFSALSYTWGDSNARGEIYIDYQVMKVTKSVEIALRYVRNLDTTSPKASSFQARDGSDSTETFWWIDAVCINQDDVIEKNVQVNQMTRLYKCASLVRIWLGEAANDSDLALHLIQQIGYRPPASGPELEDWLYIRRDNETHRFCGPGEQPRRLPEEPIIREDLSKRHTTALRNFFGRQWFQRVWVRQEVALPEYLSVHCGSQSCSWEALARTASVIDFLSNNIFYNPLSSSKAELAAPSWIQAPTGVQQMVELESIRTSTGKDGKSYISLADLIVHAKQCQASDARDKVFSMLGLADPSYVHLKPDYTSDAKQAWREAVIQLLPISLDFLGACQNVESQHDLPSWVPDLNCAWRRYPFHCRKDTKQNSDLPASSIVKHSSPTYRLCDDQMVLEIQGWHVDTVQELCPQHILPNMSLDEIHEVGAGWTKWLQGFCEGANAQEHLILMLLSLQGEAQNEHFFTFGSLPLDHLKFTPLKGRPLYQDPTFRRASRLLLPKGIHMTEKGIDPAIMALRRYGLGRKLAKFSSGQCGLVPDGAIEGDIIVVFPGCTWTHCLRSIKRDDFLVVGETAAMILKPSTSPMIDPNSQLRIRLV